MPKMPVGEISELLILLAAEPYSPEPMMTTFSFWIDPILSLLWPSSTVKILFDDGRWSRDGTVGECPDHSINKVPTCESS